MLAQRHLVSGALRLHNTGESLTATPVFPDRRIRLKLDLTARSWAVVEAALRSQDISGKCGTLMDPDKGLARLRALAARGIKVRLPDSIFRAVSLPARLHKSVRVSQRTVAAPADRGEPPHRNRDALVERFRSGERQPEALSLSCPASAAAGAEAEVIATVER